MKQHTYERCILDTSVVFIDNKSTTTNIIFTGAGQKYYMMISWFNDSAEYNYLYLNPSFCNYEDIDKLTSIIKSFRSLEFNMIGISYGAIAAIVYSTLFPTNALIIVDPERLGWKLDITKYIPKIKSNIFYHRSLHPHDIENYKTIRDALEKTDIFYLTRCSLSCVHSSNIPGESLILSYIKFSEKSCKGNILMKDTKMDELCQEFLPWT